MSEKETNAYAKGFKEGWDKADERILKIVNDFKSNPIVLKTKDIINEKIVIADYFKWDGLYDLIKAIKNQGDDAILGKPEMTTKGFHKAIDKAGLRGYEFEEKKGCGKHFTEPFDYTCGESEVNGTPFCSTCKEKEKEAVKE